MRLALQTFLERNWSPAQMADVSVQFVVSELLPLLGHPCLQKDTGEFNFQVICDAAVSPAVNITICSLHVVWNGQHSGP